MCFARIRARQAVRLYAAVSVLSLGTIPAMSWGEPTAIFFADHQHLYAIDPQASRITQSAGLSAEPEALAPALNGGVWVLANQRLLRYSGVLAYEREIDLRRTTGAFEGVKRLVANPYDGSLWVAGEKTVVRLGTDGVVLGSWKASDDIRAIALDPDESLWVLAKKKLWRLSKDAAVLQALETRDAIDEPELLAVDRFGNRLWLSNGKGLTAVSTETMQLLARLDLRTLLASSVGDDEFHKAVVLAAYPIFGTVWVVTKTALVLFDRDGGFLKQVDLTRHNLGQIEAIAFDAANFGLWIGGKKAVARFQTNGEFVARIPIAGELVAIAASGFKLLPTLALLAPPDGLITNNAFTPLRYRLGADCTGTPCVLDSEYAPSLRLEADANGQALGPFFTRTPYEAAFTPTTRWPEGLNRLGAQATDLYGHRSDRLTSSFTIDTIPPKFLLVDPPDGSSARSSSVTISGSVDDATANVALYDGSGKILSSAAANFSFAVTLKPGLNTFVLTARDPAGNETSVQLRVHLGSLDATLIGLASGTIVETDRLSLSGTYFGPENSGVTVNGVVALTDGNQFYVNNLPLESGQNTLTITVTAPDGQTVTKTVEVTSTRSTPLRVEAEPQTGVAPLRSRFRISLSNGGTLSEIAIDADGDGNLDVSGIDPSFPLEYVFDDPGVYQPRILATDSNGNTWSQSITLIVQDPTRVDDFFGRLWHRMNEALARGDLPTALGYLNETAQRKYRPAFEALLPSMAEIVASYSPPARLSVDETIGEYAISRPYQGRMRVYLINFLRDAAGVWRLDSM